QDRILALFDALMANTGADTFRGCPFLMTLAEYPDPSSTAHASAHAVKAWVRAKLHELTRQLPDRNPPTADTLADQLALIIEGLHAPPAALGPTGPARHAHALAALVIAATADRDPAGDAPSV